MRNRFDLLLTLKDSLQLFVSIRLLSLWKLIRGLPALQKRKERNLLHLSPSSGQRINMMLYLIVFRCPQISSYVIIS